MAKIKEESDKARAEFGFGVEALSEGDLDLTALQVGMDDVLGNEELEEVGQPHTTTCYTMVCTLVCAAEK